MCNSFTHIHKTHKSVSSRRMLTIRSLDLSSYIDPLSLHLKECFFFVLYCIFLSPPPRIRVETPTTWDDIRGRGLWKVIMFKWGPLGGTSVLGLVSLSEEKETRACSSPALWEHSKKVAICKQGEGSSPKPDHAGPLMMDFRATSTVRNKVPLRHSVYAIFVRADQTKTSFKII